MNLKRWILSVGSANWKKFRSSALFLVKNSTLAKICGRKMEKIKKKRKICGDL